MKVGNWGLVDKEASQLSVLERAERLKAKSTCQGRRRPCERTSTKGIGGGVADSGKSSFDMLMNKSGGYVYVSRGGL